MQQNQYLNDYYSAIEEDKRLITQHGLVEYETTMRYIGKYLNPGSKILEIGAGTGRYSHALSREGYKVDAVELISHNIEIFHKNTQPHEKIRMIQGNAMDLNMFENNSYDITLLLGPLYHLFCEQDKQKALSEAIRVTKKGGVVFAAYCISDASVLDYGFKKGHIHELIEKDMLDTESFQTFSKPSDLFELHRKEDIDALMKNYAVTRLHYVATDGFTRHMTETVDNMDRETFDIYLKYHFAVCERSDMVGITHHALDIFLKDETPST